MPQEGPGPPPSSAGSRSPRSEAAVKDGRGGIRHLKAGRAAGLVPAWPEAALISGREEGRRLSDRHDRRLDDLEQLGCVELDKHGGNKPGAQKHEKEEGARPFQPFFLASEAGI
jgi:hypothetical protein